MFVKLDNDLRAPQPRRTRRIQQGVLGSLNVHNDNGTL